MKDKHSVACGGPGLQEAPIAAARSALAGSGTAQETIEALRRRARSSDHESRLLAKADLADVELGEDLTGLSDAELIAKLAG